VLAPFAGASDYSNQGQRVVVGQRMLQAATDVFLGWTQTPIEHRPFYIRRLKDSRLANIGARLEAALLFYAALCGRTLARAHARAGDAVVIRRVYRKWHSVRRRDWRLRVRLCRPDGTKLGHIPGRDQGPTNRGPGAVVAVGGQGRGYDAIAIERHVNDVRIDSFVSVPAPRLTPWWSFAQRQRSAWMPPWWLLAGHMSFGAARCSFRLHERPLSQVS
jgi:hypothetical protein